MKKLLLILICLFVSFEVKSQSRPDFNDIFELKEERERLSKYYPTENIQIQECLKYFEKGKTISSWSNKVGSTGSLGNRIDTVFVYKGKTYLIMVNTRKKQYENFKKEGLSYIGCLKFDINRKQKDQEEFQIMKKLLFIYKF